MGADVLNNVNAMPAPTWHRLDMNETAVELPEGLSFAAQVEVEAAAELIGEAGAFDAAVAALQERVDAARAAGPADTRAILKAVDPDVDPANLDIPALSTYEHKAVRQEMANNVAEAFECGMGEQATAWLAEAAGKAAATVFAPAAGKRGQATVRIAGVDGAANVAAIDVVAPAGATFDLTVSLDSPAAGSGVVGVVLRVFAGENAHVNVTSVHTLDETWMALDDTGIVCDEGAFVTVRHRMLGAGKSYTGLATDLRGDLSRVDVDTRYLAAGQDVRDFNYVVRHRGKKTRCNIDANGALMGESKKVLRGTIDLVRGCKGAEGTERETVLLVDERVENKTIPVILCDEDDVAGNHGATIGHVAADQLFYLKCRGLSQEAAEGLFATATLEETALAVEDETVRAGVGRLAGRLGIPYQEVES
mgnify:FL=1